MEIFKRSKRAKQRSSRPDIGKCKKHPKHKQSPGVCSLCLNEKLSQISITSFTTTTGSYSTSYSSSLSTSSYCSSCSSPGEYILEGNWLLSLLFERTKMFRKSRQMEFDARRRNGEVDGSIQEKKKKKKAAFWSNLLHRKKDIGVVS